MQYIFDHSKFSAATLAQQPKTKAQKEAELKKKADEERKQKELEVKKAREEQRRVNVR